MAAKRSKSAAAARAEKPAEKCAAQHFGPWMVEPKWFAQAVSAVKAGTFQPDAPPTFESDGYAITPNGIAVVPVFGQMTKEDSSFGGCNSVRTRKAVRDAGSDPNVRAILLHIDSPGGTVRRHGRPGRGRAVAQRRTASPSTPTSKTWAPAPPTGSARRAARSSPTPRRWSAPSAR
jgi:hypothetical protein